MTKKLELEDIIDIITTAKTKKVVGEYVDIQYVYQLTNAIAVLKDSNKVLADEIAVLKDSNKVLADEKKLKEDSMIFYKDIIEVVSRKISLVNLDLQDLIRMAPLDVTYNKLRQAVYPEEVNNVRIFDMKG